MRAGSGDSSGPAPVPVPGGRPHSGLGHQKSQRRGHAAGAGGRTVLSAYSVSGQAERFTGTGTFNVNLQQPAQGPRAPRINREVKDQRGQKAGC